MPLENAVDFTQTRAAKVLRSHEAQLQSFRYSYKQVD